MRKEMWIIRLPKVLTIIHIWRADELNPDIFNPDISSWSVIKSHYAACF